MRPRPFTCRQAAVSMQVKALEDYLQVRLLRRTPQGVELTVEGERLLLCSTRAG